MNRQFFTTTLLILSLVVSLAADRPAVGLWNFDGTLADRSGRGNDAFAAAPAFVPGHAGQGLQCSNVPIVIPDSPELRPAPGLKIDCWVKPSELGPSYQPILIKDRAYQIRIESPKEGAQFTFFLNLNGWEPRVRSKAPAKIGEWYHLVAAWDGKEISLEVNGDRTTIPRAGVPIPSREPVELGHFHGVLDELRIENPAAQPSGVAQWLFDGNLRDSSPKGNHLTGEGVSFVPVPGGQALKSTRSVQVTSNPSLQLSPGFRIDCSVFFDQVPAAGGCIVMKNGEYQLRLDSQKEGSTFAFFVNLNGWEPRERSEERVVPGKWYRITAAWDGFTATLDVNGERSRHSRRGLPKPTNNPLVVGTLGGLIDNLKIENPRLPTLQVAPAKQEHAILLVGRPEKFTSILRNIGPATDKVAVQFKLPTGIRNLGSATHDFGAMPTGAEKTITWTIQADTPVVGAAEIQVAAAGASLMTARHPLVFFPTEDGPPPSASDKLPPTSDGKATTYYIDSLAGNNASSGTSPDAPWKDFTKINGRVLNPGQRLLLKRGSVFNQELTLSARGTSDNWTEIGAYGEGARPIIRRNWDIDERCALIRNPDYLRIRSLTVCYAGKGLIVSYSEPNHSGLLVEDCIAHHIEGLYRVNAHGIPEWRDRLGAPGDRTGSRGIAITGTQAKDLVLRNCETFQCSSGWEMRGHDTVVDRVFCHDNYAHNTSPHPFLVDIHRAILRNSIFDASGWHASAGTMGIMLGSPQGLIIRNCYFRNQPDSGSHDEGGIDFENSGNATLIDHCTFENNAGAAIEVLGLRSPQTTNIEIRKSRFIRNNTAKKLGPSEIFVWGRTSDPAVCCSSGSVNGNGYVLLPGIQFFVNEKPELTAWALRDNTQYSNVSEIDRAMPFNRPPTVDAGPDLRTSQRRVLLAGRVSDDGQPSGQSPTTTWELLEGPGPVRFENAHATATAATFEKPGDYLLRLVADDGELWLSRMVTVHILSPSTSVVAAWEFNKNLDKEGWTEVNPGTTVQQWPAKIKEWSTTSHPVKLVAGGYYILALENTPDAQLLSPDQLNLPLTGKEKLTFHFQNHTPAAQMRVRFTTDADPTWTDAKSLPFPVTPNDLAPRTYTVAFASLPAWKGRLRQLRLDLATGQPLTGTCRFDYIWLSTPAP
jgi:hypothetical protein